MGVFYYIKSVALIEDLDIEDHYKNPHEFFLAADKAYDQVSVFDDDAYAFSFVCSM